MDDRWHLVELYDHDAGMLGAFAYQVFFFDLFRLFSKE